MSTGHSENSDEYSPKSPNNSDNVDYIDDFGISSDRTCIPLDPNVYIKVKDRREEKEERK